MDKEAIRKLWAKFIESFKDSIKQPPWLFTEPNCATCTHWHLLDEDTLEMISISFPKEYEQICRGMEGKIIKAYEEDGRIVDTYNVHIFYGFCKRYPPAWPESDSITRIGLFTRTNTKTPGILSGYRFPFLPHDEQCGEWKQDKWVSEVLSEKK